MKDRYKATKLKARRDRANVMGYNHDHTDLQASNRATKGETYICRTCRQWWKVEQFTYVYQGEEKLATNCRMCRAWNRKRYNRR
jgi:hypothetical protein